MAKKKIPDGVIEANLCALLSGKPDPTFKRKAGAFPHKILVMRSDNASAPVALQVVDNTAEIVATDFVAGLLREYVSYLSGALASYNVPFRRCRAIVESWMQQTIHLHEIPKAVAFKSDPELCMARLPFDPIIPVEGALKSYAPVFAGMLERVKTNADAFCMRIGSLYDMHADRKQAVWMSGPPDCGKSQFAWMIEVLAGGSVGYLGRGELEKSYWKAQLVGKRVGIVHEAPARFIRGDAFKAITGDAKHSIDQKNEKIYIARIDALMFFFSNDTPEVPHDDALMRRIIDCRIDPVPADEQVPEVEFRDRLKAELPYIIGHCLHAYSKLPAGSRIPCKTDALVETIGQFESDYLDFLEHHFIVDPLPPAAVGGGDEGAFVLRSRLRQLVEERFGNHITHQSICKRILKNRYFVEEKKKEFQTNAAEKVKRLYVYYGIRERTDEERQFLDIKGKVWNSSISDLPGRPGVAQLRPRGITS